MIPRSQTHEVSFPHAQRIRAAIVTAGARWITTLLLGQLVWIFALAANPGLHEWAHHHHESGQAEHHCVVDLFSGGTCEASVVPATFAVPIPALLTSGFPEAAVRFPFSHHRTGVLEHAPPARS